MIKILKTLAIACLFSACTGPTADFTAVKSNSNTAAFVLTNTSTNYSTIKWVIDGVSMNDNNEKFTHTFTKAGYHNIELVAYNSLQQVESVLKEVNTARPKKVTVTGVELISFYHQSSYDQSSVGGNNHEDDSPGPDLVLILGKIGFDQTNSLSNLTPKYTDVTNSDLPLIFNPDSYGEEGNYTISNKNDIYLKLVDVDNSDTYDDKLMVYKLEIDRIITSSYNPYPNVIFREIDNVKFNIFLKWE